MKKSNLETRRDWRKRARVLANFVDFNLTLDAQEAEEFENGSLQMCEEARDAVVAIAMESQRDENFEMRLAEALHELENANWLSGRSDGIHHGRWEQSRSMLIGLLEQRVGSLAAPTLDQINKLSIAQLEQRAQWLLEIVTIDDLKSWLSVEH